MLTSLYPSEKMQFTLLTLHFLKVYIYGPRAGDVRKKEPFFDSRNVN
jgi:hypothetical protein